MQDMRSNGSPTHWAAAGASGQLKYCLFTQQRMGSAGALAASGAGGAAGSAAGSPSPPGAGSVSEATGEPDFGLPKKKPPLLQAAAKKARQRSERTARLRIESP